MPFLKNADGSLAIGTAQLTTYYATAQVSGPSGGGPSGENKAMLSILNPASSGKQIRVIGLEYYPLSSSGTNLMLDVQLRKITAHTGGTAITPAKRELADAASSAEVKSEPSVTGGAAADQVSQHSVQANTMQAPNTHTWAFGVGSGEKPFVLEEGEGLVVHQVTGNGGTNAVGLLWTEQ